MADQDKFWMVLGVGMPTYRHPTLSGACTEAERLATSNPGQRFTVLESVASVQKTSVTWTRHGDASNQIDGSNDVPF